MLFEPKSLLSFSIDGSLLVVINESNNEARFINFPELTEKHQSIDLQGPVACCSISCENNWLAVGRNDGDTIEVFDIPTGKRRGEPLKSGRDNLGWFKMQFSPTNNSLIAAGGWDGQVNVWNLESSKRLTMSGHFGMGTLRSLEYSQEGSILYSCGSEGQIKAWQMPDCEPLSSIRLFHDRNISVYGAAFSADRSIFAAMHRNTGRIHVVRAAIPDDVKKSTWLAEFLTLICAGIC